MAHPLPRTRLVPHPAQPFPPWPAKLLRRCGRFGVWRAGQGHWAHSFGCRQHARAALNPRSAFHVPCCLPLGCATVLLAGVAPARGKQLYGTIKLDGETPEHYISKFSINQEGYIKGKLKTENDEPFTTGGLSMFLFNAEDWPEYVTSPRSLCLLCLLCPAAMHNPPPHTHTHTITTWTTMEGPPCALCAVRYG